MKKIINLLMLIVVLIGMTSCGKTPGQKQRESIKAEQEITNEVNDIQILLEKEGIKFYEYTEVTKALGKLPFTIEEHANYKTLESLLSEYISYLEEYLERYTEFKLAYKGQMTGSRREKSLETIAENLDHAEEVVVIARLALEKVKLENEINRELE